MSRCERFLAFFFKYVDQYEILRLLQTFEEIGGIRFRDIKIWRFA